MIEMMVTSSVLILVIFLLRRVTRGRISMRFRYALWIVAALRLMLPVAVTDSAMSVMNFLPQGFRETVADWEADGGWHLSGIQGAKNTDATDIREMGGGIAAEERTPISLAEGEVNLSEKEGLENTSARQQEGASDVTGAAESSGSTTARKQPVDMLESQTNGAWMHRALLLVWILGTMLVGGYMITGQIRFVKILHKRRLAVNPEEIPGLFTDRLQKRRMKVYCVKGLASPCLVGRHIYVDTGLPQERQKFIHVLAHEYCHAAQFDSFWAFLRSVLAAVYWFHPLVWAAAFAARQDSELSCDEAVIKLLGEQERFAYGRTLLYLLSCRQGPIDCAGTALTMEGRKRGVKERVNMIARRNGRKKWVAAMVSIIMLLACGCAFTGSRQDETGEQTPGQEKLQEATESRTDRQQVVGDASDKEYERIRNEYEDAMEALDAQEQALEQAQQDAAFWSVLNYQGVMAGRDDSELALDRELDNQKEPPENGWYLICRNEEEKISLYGLYTQEFGPRGIKMLIGEDVNTYDIAWCPSGMNKDSANIRVLEKAEDGLPRRFVFKILSVNTSEQEIWNLYSGFRYDTGSVQLEELTAKMYREWVDRNLSFVVSESGDEVLITYDNDMVLAPLDISAYADQKVEEVLISPNVAGFELDSDIYAGEVSKGQDGYEGVVLHLAVGLKLDGLEGVWFDGLSPLCVQVLCHQEQGDALALQERGFVLQRPKVDMSGELRSPMQSWKLEEIREGTASDTQISDRENHLDRPLVNDEEGHHDLEIIFRDPCPDYDRISAWYGERTNPATGKSEKHNGVDMAAGEGADILAAADGSVFETGFDTVYGNYVVLWHGQSGQMTYYMHCKEVLVSQKDQVKSGDKIATVGQTGMATGSLLHFAVSYEGEWQEPLWGKGQTENE